MIKTVASIVLQYSFASLLKEAVAINPHQRVHGEVVRYDFLPSSCKHGEFPNLIPSDTLSSLKRQVATTVCPQGLGIQNTKHSFESELPLLATTTTTDVLLYHLGEVSNGVTFELWFKPHAVNSTQGLQPIFALGQPAETPQGDEEDLSSCGRADLQVSQHGQYLQVNYRTSDGLFHCNNPILVQNPLVADRMVHFVFALEDGRQHFYINGKANPFNHELKEQFGARLDHWHSDYNLQFFPRNLVNHVRDGGLWDGTLYRFAIYDKFLSKSQARQTFAAGVAPTPPFAINRTVEINEDAEDVPGSHEAAWYKQERNASDPTLPQIELLLGHVDAEVYELQKANGIEDAYEPEIPGLFITALPDRGRLYQSDGTPIQLGSYGHALVQHNSSVIYIPRLNGYSIFGAYTEFSYCVAESTVLDSDSPCDPGQVEIVVLEVNDPPTLVQLPVFNVTPGLDDNALIFLHGMDDDVGDDVFGVVVTRFPAYGNLHYTNRNHSYGRAMDALLDNSTMDAPAIMGYRYTGPENNVTADGFVNVDYFKYKAFDTFGAFSEEGVIEIHIRTSLSAENSTVTVRENNVSELVFFGNDTSGLQRRLGFQIISIPPSRTGRFSDVQSPDTPLETGSILMDADISPYNNGVKIQYAPELYFFNYPTLDNITEPMEIVFRAVVLDEMGIIVAASGEAYMKVLVQNVNDEPTLTIPSNFSHTVEVKRVLNWDAELCPNDAIHNATMKGEPHGCKTVTLLNGITLDDPDLYIDRVRVDVRCNIGVFSLNLEHMDKAEFVSCGNRSSTWNCTGNPFGADQALTFLAIPGDVTDILTNLNYWSHVVGDDNVTVTIYDGIGHECPTKREQSFHRLRGDMEETLNEHGCYVVSKTFPIKVTPFEFRKIYKVKRKFPQDLKEAPADIWVVAAICVLVLLFLCRRGGVPDEFYEDDEQEDKNATTSDTKKDPNSDKSAFPDALMQQSFGDTIPDRETFDQQAQHDHDDASLFSNMGTSRQHERPTASEVPDLFPEVSRDEWEDEMTVERDSRSLNEESSYFTSTTQSIMDPLSSGSQQDSPTINTVQDEMNVDRAAAFRRGSDFSSPYEESVFSSGSLQNPFDALTTSSEPTAGNSTQDWTSIFSPSSSAETAQTVTSRASVWRSYLDPNTGNPYYHNTETGLVTWEQPDQFEEPSSR